MSSIINIITTTLRSSAPMVIVQNGTYWESLSDEERQESVNEHKSRILGDKIGWGYAGPLQKKWNEEVYPAISQIINHKENYEKIFRKFSTRVIKPCSLYMVGDGRKTHTHDKPWERAHPTIVTISSSRRVAQTLCSLLKESKFLKSRNLGFDFMSFEDTGLKLTAGDGSTTSNHEASLCGLPICTPILLPDSIWEYRRATIGGVIIIDGMPFVLTAAHIFYPDGWGNEDEDVSTSPDRSMGDMSKVESSESSEAEYFTSQIHARLLDHLKGADVAIFQNPHNTEDEDHSPGFESETFHLDSVKSLGYLHQLSMSPDLDSVICPDLDWALISLNSPGKPNTVKTPAGNVITLSSISSTSPTGSVVVVAGSTGIYDTKAPGRIDGIVLPGSLHMQEVWTIDSDSKPGDCGAWVVDPLDGNIHGMIVATSSGAQESYFVPAKNIFNSIRAKWPANAEIELLVGEDTTINTENIMPFPVGKLMMEAGNREKGRRRALLRAAADGRLEWVKRLLTADANFNVAAAGPRIRTELSLAVEGGPQLRPTEEMKLSVGQNNVYADSEDDGGRTPLSWAAEKGHLAVVELLTNRHDVDADTKDWTGRTPLSRAAEKGHLAVVELLTNRHDVKADTKDKTGRTPLSWAAEMGHGATVRLLADRHGVNADSKDQTGRTPLLWAAEKGNEAIVWLLTERYSVNADPKDNNGRTPLSWAAEKGYEAILWLLADKYSVNADSKDNNGRTPLLWAAEKGHEAIVWLLTERYSVNADSKDNNGRTPLSWAASRGHATIAQLLITRDDVDINTKDGKGYTPLSWAAVKGHEAVVKLLLDRVGLYADSKDDEGRTPLSRAAEMGHEAIVKLLADRHDVDADSKDKNSRTPLSWAVEEGHKAIVRILAGRDGVDVDLRDASGDTPIPWAAVKSRWGIVKPLESYSHKD